LVYASQGYMLICLQIQEKVLPPAVLREQHQEKIKALELKLGHRVSRDERLRMKDELEHTLLGKAFSKSSRVYAYFDTEHNRLIVDTCSQRKLDRLYKVLNEVMVEYQPEALALQSPSAILTRWLSQQQYPDAFSILDRCAMQDKEEKKGKVSLSRKDLFGDSVQQLLDEGCFVTQLRLNWAEKINFSLKEDFAISGLQFSGEVKDLAKDGMPESAEERFAADFFIMVQTLNQFLDDLLPEFLDTTVVKDQVEAVEAEAEAVVA